MKRNTTILVMMLMLLNLYAQQRPRVRDMHIKKWDFIAAKMQLSVKQAENIKPLFMEYEMAVWKIMEQNRDAHRKFIEDKRTSTKPDFERINDAFVNSEMQKAQLMKNYYNKLKKQLTAEQIYEYFDTERSFRKELIRDWQGKGRRVQQR
ncbi:MAG: hypothetical protein JXR27_13635 [Paludibacteraceae bacterium]|nr:hypothetical protein [Paludibacteraceae bacterium]